MNPVQQFGQTNTMMGFFSAWAYTDVLSKLIYNRIVELRLELYKSQGTADVQVVIPETEMQYLVANAIIGAHLLSTSFFEVGGQTGPQQQQRKTA